MELGGPVAKPSIRLKRPHKAKHSIIYEDQITLLLLLFFDCLEPYFYIIVIGHNLSFLK